jgi:hypothetical protein
MSALGTKRTSILAPHMSAFGGKADKYAAVEFHRLSALSLEQAASLWREVQIQAAKFLNQSSKMRISTNTP